MSRKLLLSWIVFFVLLCASAGQTKPTSLQLIQGTRALAKLWREASLPQHRTSPESVIEHYLHVIDTSEYLESPFKKWYLGATHFGLARAYARLDLTDSSRKHILQAVDNNFWNFDVMYADPILRSSLGVLFLDSLSQAYAARRAVEESTWRVQLPIVYGPQEGTIWRNMGNIDDWFTDTELRGRTLDSMYRIRWDEMIKASHSKQKPTIIIALHGGNASYREFASHWTMIGQMTNSYVIAPPGIVRYSKNLNSWDADYEQIDSYLNGLIEKLRDQHGALPPIYLSGFSQGACISLKFGLVHPEMVKGVIAFSGFMDTAVDHDLVRHATAEGLKLYAVSGEFDSENFKNSLRLLKRTFNQVGANFTFIEEKQMIHELPEPFFKHFTAAWKQVSN